MITSERINKLARRLYERAMLEEGKFHKEENIEPHLINSTFHVYAMHGEDHWTGSTWHASKFFHELRAQNPGDEIHVAVNFTRRDQMEGDREVVIHSNSAD